MNLDPAEIRILGCLLEKERHTPEYYPLSLHALTTACNQSTNREPVVDYSEKLVQDTLYILRDKKVVTAVFGAGSRVQKFRHNLPDLFTLDPREIAVLTVLLLRGAQTVGEIRSRSERVAAWNSLEEVETTLAALTGGDEPLVRTLPTRPGQKEQRHIHLLGSTPDEDPVPVRPLPGGPSRLDRLEAELTSLRAEFEQFKKQFES